METEITKQHMKIINDHCEKHKISAKSLMIAGALHIVNQEKNYANTTTTKKA